MRKVWTDEIKAYLLTIYKGRFVDDIRDMINEKFNLSLTSGSVKSFLSANHLQTGYKNDGRSNTIFPPEYANWIRANRYGYTLKDFTELFNKHFNTSYREAQIRYFCHNHKIYSGVDCRFKKGNVSYNKGRKGYCPPGCEKGWFKKGHVPANFLEVGTEVTTRDGYINVKIANPNTWALKHRLVWEKVHGKINPGEAIIFIDGDKTNCNINNLRLVTKAELAVLNHLKRIQYNDPELNQAGITITRIERALAEKGYK